MINILTIQTKFLNSLYLIEHNEKWGIYQMYNHLFLQGDIDIGKSTIIKDAVLPYIEDVGGYFTTKLFVNNKKTGFAIRPIKEDSDYILRSDIHDIYKIPGLFMYRHNGSCKFKSNLFTRKAKKYLTDACSKKLIVIDEIGGIELTNSKFIKTLLEVLGGIIPILGVVKSPKNLYKLSKAAKFDTNACNLFLKRFYLSDNIKVLNVSIKNRSEVKDKVCNFVDSVFKI